MSACINILRLFKKEASCKRGGGHCNSLYHKVMYSIICLKVFKHGLCLRSGLRDAIVSQIQNYTDSPEGGNCNYRSKRGHVSVECNMFTAAVFGECLWHL